MGFDQSELGQGPIYNIILNNLSISVITEVSQTKLIRGEKFKSTLLCMNAWGKSFNVII